MTKNSSKTVLYRYRFETRLGTAEFDEVSSELTVSGKLVRIPPKARMLLALLLRRAPDPVTRDEVLKVVWSYAFRNGEIAHLAPNVIDNQVRKLRRALGEDNGKLIAAQTKTGFRLTVRPDRVVVSSHFASDLQLKEGMPVPRREQFILRSRLGQNASNEVWLARRGESGEQRVYKFPLDGESLVRLKREAKLLRFLRKSLGERPDFVQLIDSNFQEQPFFLEFEYAGPNLLTWSETSGNLRACSEDQRMELFLQIADAVAAAHSVGVVHKDLKPTNILVTSEQGRLQLRVSDFGSSRLLDMARLGAFEISQHGLTQAVDKDSASGTLLYLAPELPAQEPTLRSDVFSLGLILYQLQKGDLRYRKNSGWERDVAEEVLREDISKATDGDPTRRHHNANELAERVRARKQLSEERLAAARKEAIDQAMRAAYERQRQRRPLVIAATGILALGFAATSFLYYRELHTERLLAASQTQVRQEAVRTATVAQFLDENVLSSSDPFLGEAQQKRTIKTALDDAASSIEGRFDGDPLTEASIRMALGKVYIRILEGDAAVRQWQRVVQLLEPMLAATDPRLLESRLYLANGLVLTSRFADARQVLSNVDRTRVHLDNAETELLSNRTWGIYYLNLQQCDHGIPFIEHALVMLKQLHPSDTSSLDLTRIMLGQCYIGVSRFKDAERLAKDLIVEVQGRTKPSELTLALARNVYGDSLSYQQRYPEAQVALEDAYRVVVEKLGPDNLRTLTILNARCNLYSESDQVVKAVACLQDAYTQTRQRYGDNHWLTAGALANLGIEQFISKRYDAATESLSAGREGLIKTLPADAPLTLLAGYYLARCYIQHGDADRAAPLAASLTPGALAGAEPGAPWEKRLAFLRGLILMQKHQLADAIAALQPAADMSAADDPNDSIVLEAQTALKHLRHSNSDTSSL